MPGLLRGRRAPGTRRSPTAPPSPSSARASARDICCSAAWRSSESSAPSRVFSGAQIAMNASTSSQIRRCSGAGSRSSSSGASRANGPPIMLERQLQHRVRAAPRDLLDHRLDQRPRERRRRGSRPASRAAPRPTGRRAAARTRRFWGRARERVLLPQARVDNLSRLDRSIRASCRKSSISSAGSVSIFVEPRAPSATETLATVAMSGASTTLTKSNSPSVAHWCSTLQPSSSTSLFTCAQALRVRLEGLDALLRQRREEDEDRHRGVSFGRVGGSLPWLPGRDTAARRRGRAAG